jgi:hypothetical protein
MFKTKLFLISIKTKNRIKNLIQIHQVHQLLLQVNQVNGVLVHQVNQVNGVLVHQVHQVHQVHIVKVIMKEDHTLVDIIMMLTEDILIQMDHTMIVKETNKQVKEDTMIQGTFMMQMEVILMNKEILL